MRIEDIVRDNIKALAPYSTARDEYKGEIGVYLDANENPYENGYNRYPDPRQQKLKEKISKIKSISPENLFIGNGSDEPIDLLYRIFCRPSIDNAVIVAPSYGMYSVSADINDVEVRTVQLEEDFSLDIAKVKAAIDENSKLVFFCSPNNPSGNSLNRQDILDVASSYNIIVVVDEAYIDFSNEPSFASEITKYPNIVVLQTMSKAWGMAAVRCGLAIASTEVLHYMNKVKYPYNIGKLTQEWVFNQLDKVEEVALQVEEMKRERDMLITELARFSFVEKVYPSDANFILIKVDDANRYYDLLIAEKIIVRSRNKIKGCEGCLRITIGTPEENRRLLNILNAI